MAKLSQNQIIKEAKTRRRLELNLIADSQELFDLQIYLKTCFKKKRFFLKKRNLEGKNDSAD